MNNIEARKVAQREANSRNAPVWIVMRTDCSFVVVWHKPPPGTRTGGFSADGKVEPEHSHGQSGQDK